MRSLIGSVVCTAALLVAGWVPSVGAVPQSAAFQPADSAIDALISQRINADPSLKAHNVRVSVKDGVATLTGTVATEAERAKAARLATIDGIARVDNKIAVDADAAAKGTTGTIKEKTKEGAEKTKDGAEKVVDKTKEGSKAAYEKTKDGTEKTVDATKKGSAKVGEEVTDGWITTKISSDFVNEGLLHDSNINVDTNNHVVTLHGTVLSEAGRARAIAIAKGTSGVKTVVDKLTIGPKK